MSIEPVKWSKMTPDERDKLIAEKITGWQSKECNPEPKQMVVRMLDSKSYGYACYKCGSHGRVEKGYYRHLELTPRYSTDLNAAWQILEAGNEAGNFFGYSVTGTNMPNNEMVYICRLNIYGQTTEAAADTPQDAICVAVLRVHGVEIEV